MRVVFNTYPMAFDVPGGGEMQLMAYYRHAPACGVTPVLFNLWDPQLDKADIVHFFSAVGGSFHFCNYVRRRGLPLVMTSSLWVTEATRHLYPIDEIRSQFALADAIVTNAEVESDQLATVLGLPRDKFHAVYNGVEESFLIPADPTLFRAHAPDVGDFLLNVGNIEPRKNQLALIRAVKAMPERTLVLIGHIRDKAYGEQCLQEGGAQVRYLGPMPHDSVLLRSAMAAAAAFVLPSTLETPGLAALEAAGQGARIALTEVGSTREYFGDSVAYLDPSREESILGAVREALARPHNPEALRRRIEQRFTWPRVMPRLVEVYRRVIPASE